MMDDSTSEQVVHDLVRSDPMVWFETQPKIENKRGLLEHPVANRLQERLGEYVRYCRKHRIPMRICIPKPRQRGISTITVGISQWLQKLMVRHGLIVGGKDKQVKNLWNIYQRYAQTDKFPWGFDGYVMESKAGWNNGEEGGIGSTMGGETAGGRDPGRSGTYQILICTETAYWGHDASVRNAEGVLTGLLACVPNEPDTLVVLESTSSGGSGMFYRRCMEAVDMEDFLNGARSPSGFVRLFVGLFEFPDVTSTLRDVQEEAEIFAGIGARNEAEAIRERDLRFRYNLKAGQIKRWRELLAECGNDPDKRDREYPVTLEDAFRAAQPCRFNMANLRIMKDEARGVAAELQWGLLENPDPRSQEAPYGARSYTWRKVQTEEEANFCLWQGPEAGMRYHIAVDNAGGRAVGDDPTDSDCHAAAVIRQGYFDPSLRKWVRPAAVCAIKKDQRVDVDLLEEWVFRMHVFYGRCLIVPEANNDAGLIRGLRNRGCPIYEQERPATQTQSHKPSGKLGFWCRGGEQESTRRWIIENLARAVREIDRVGEGVFIPFPWILDEMEHFATDPDTGKAEAMEGWHDDWVMMLAIGLATGNGATTYVPPSFIREEPEDVRRIQGQVKAYEEPGFRV